jgi:hypothetical protein
MVNEENEKGTTARVVTNVLHPYVVLPPVVALVAYHGNSAPEVWLKWTICALLPAYIFSLAYMQARVILVAHTTGIQMSFRSLFRERPGELLLLACLFGVPSALILHSLGCPPSIIAAWVGVAATGLVIALVNCGYRASIHLALLTTMVTSVVILFRGASFIAVLLIPLLGISRYRVGEHTPGQLVIGGLLGFATTVAVFQGFGLL